MNSIVRIPLLVLAMTSVGGQPPEIGSLTVKIPLEVGVSDGICSALVRDVVDDHDGGNVFRYFFPVLDVFVTGTDGSNARKTMANVYGTFAELDRTFARELRRTVHFQLKMYNALANKWLTSGVTEGTQGDGFDSPVEAVRIYGAYQIFGFLDVTDASVRTDFDNVISYAFAKPDCRLPSLVARISRYEHDADSNNTESDSRTISRLRVQQNYLMRLANAFGERFRSGWFDYYELARIFNHVLITDIREPMKPYYERLVAGMKCKIWVNPI